MHVSHKPFADPHMTARPTARPKPRDELSLSDDIVHMAQDLGGGGGRRGRAERGWSENRDGADDGAGFSRVATSFIAAPVLMSHAAADAAFILGRARPGAATIAGPASDEPPLDELLRRAASG